MSSNKTIETTAPGKELHFDLPGLRIGSAVYPEGPTGCTVFHFPQRVNYAVDVRGGAPGVQLLGQWESGEDELDAICFTGGSAYGMEAFSGVASEILSERRNSGQWGDIARVQGAVIFDFRPRSNVIYPDKALGEAAFRAAKPGVFQQGRAGAGVSATVGKMPGPSAWEAAGQGGACMHFRGATVAVFTVVNAVGVVLDRSGKVVCGLKDRETGNRSHPYELLMQRENTSTPSAQGNTTLTLVATNLTLSPFSLRQLARQVHTSMARCIHPFHAPTDGDVLFAISTAQEVSESVNDVELGVIASEVAWDAVLSACGITP